LEVPDITDFHGILPAVTITIPLLAAVLILITRRHENVREGVTIVAAITMLGSVLAMLPAILDSGRVTLILLPMVPGGDLFLKVDAFGMVFALTAATLWLINSFYAIGYMRALKEHAQTRFFFCLAVAIAAAIGIAFSANLVTLFMFYEILTIITYPLVVHIETPEAMKAGRRYLTYLLVGGIFLLAATVLTYILTGSTEFVPGGFLEGSGAALTLQILFVLFMIGFVKAAWMPLHAWLPAAMIAPTPVSAFLHAVAVVTAGVFGIVRVAGWVFGMTLMASLGLGAILAVIASFTIITASLFALTEDNLKRRLAYSTVSQLSYILLGVSMLSVSGMTGAMAHIPFHAFMKITLFFVAGAVIVSAGKENISDMKGLGQRMPVTVLMFSAAAIGICGLPPFCGIISKIYLAIGAVEGGMIALLLVLIISAVLNAAYFFPIIYTMVVERPADPHALDAVTEPPLTMLVPIILTAVISMLLFFNPSMPFMDLIQIAIDEITTGVVP
jgi:multicomponent Na+:H+ antiporter subunit D